MNMNGIQIAEHGSGFAVTVSLHVGREEFARGVTPDLAVQFQAVRNRVVHAVRATCGSYEIDPSLDDDEADEEKAAEAPVEDKSEPEPAKGRRRRRTQAGSREPKAEEAEEQEPEKPKGRRRRTAKIAASSSKSTSGDGAANASKSPSKVDNADLSKAASLAAQTVGAARVMEVLEGDFGVSKVNDLDDPDERQRCLDTLNDLADGRDDG